MRRTRRIEGALAIATLVSAAVIAGSLPASASAGKGQLFHDGVVVGTVVPPVASTSMSALGFFSSWGGASLRRLARGASTSTTLASFPSSLFDIVFQRAGKFVRLN